MLIRISRHQRRISPRSILNASASPALVRGEPIIHYWVPLSKGEERWKKIVKLFVGNACRSVPYVAKEF
jgi:hypothetical protein